MNKTVELVKLWGDYEEQNPNATIDDFCRHQLSLSEKTEKQPAQEWQLLPDINGRLMILLRRIGKYHMVYSNKALEDTGLDQIEEFGILVTIFNQINPIKSEAIYNNIIELSSGTNMLIRLKKRGLVDEYPDADDKRVKRLRLTPKGEETIKIAKERVLKVAKMMMHGLSDEDKQLCIELLTPINERFDGMFQKQKNKTFEDIFKEMM
ncbi:winged helix DNA-binding protein [Mucilaginibacter sabulilitoris]|uniref:Winged helix DNA-binding protein n=1 Tax=Mucilaginibacter sabulilitoris TaxID=1173583 RepID=A0ABZ0TV58_9SPHI|nr:winged helix DNA-binding protein [Mucilaginibacter sabulilitoris]WPU96352.1 winged helix DNA-binding protein [Mucilaginibacter sabulilitoris]